MKFTLIVSLAALVGTSLALPRADPVAGGQCKGTITKTDNGYEFCGFGEGGITFVGMEPVGYGDCFTLPPQ